MLYSDSRYGLRVNERKRISWYVDEKSLSGTGQVLNISSSGMLLEIDSEAALNEKSRFKINSSFESDIFIPKESQLVWSKKKRFSNKKYLCGVEFVNPAQKVLQNLKKRIKSKIDKKLFGETINLYIGYLLAFVIFGLAIYSVHLGVDTYDNLRAANSKMFAVSAKQANLTQDYASRFRNSETKLLVANQELNSSRDLLMGVNRELEMTKAMLVKTETMLEEARVEAKSAREAGVAELSELSAQKERELDALRATLGAQIKNLEEQSAVLKSEMSLMDSKLKYYEGNIKDMEEGSALLKLYKDNMKMVKDKIKGFKAEAKKVRDEAQREMDRVRVLLGNNGFFMRNGEAVKVDIERYNAAQVKTGSQVEIKVENFK